MISLDTGAVLDKELEVTDYADGRRFGPRLGWLSTFNPCTICKTEKCRRVQYKPCDEAYFKLWAEKYLHGGQTVLDQFGVDA